MLAFQRLCFFILVSGYATEESRQTFRGLARRILELPSSFYSLWNTSISVAVSFYFNERLRD